MTEPVHLIAVDPQALNRIFDRLARLELKLDQVHMSPQPEWIPVSQFAQRIGRSVDTVYRRIKKGQLETREEGGVTMVRVRTD